MAKTNIDGISVLDLQRELKQKKFSPTYLFAGEEEFLLSEGIQSLIDHAIDKDTNNFNLDILYGSEIEARQVVNLASSYPMLGERRVVVVKEFDKLGNKDLLIPYLQQPSPTTCLALCTVKADFRQKVYDVLKKKSQIIGCNPPNEQQVYDWIQQRIKKLGKNISQDAVQFLQTRTGNSLNIVHSEVEKLCIYVGEKNEIGVGDVEDVVGISKQYNIFELQKTIVGRNMNRALEILEHMLDAGENAIGIVAVLTGFFQKLLLLHEIQAKPSESASITSKFRLSPMFLRENTRGIKLYSREDIDNVFRHLLKADEALKFSADVKLTMTILLYNILSKTTRN